MEIAVVASALSTGSARHGVLRDAVAQVTAPGQPLEIERITWSEARIEMNVFKNAPRSLRELLGARRGGDDVFLVYEDERWTFAHR